MHIQYFIADIYLFIYSGILKIDTEIDAINATAVGRKKMVISDSLVIIYTHYFVGRIGIGIATEKRSRSLQNIEVLKPFLKTKYNEKIFSLNFVLAKEFNSSVFFINSSMSTSQCKKFVDTSKL